MRHTSMLAAALVAAAVAGCSGGGGSSGPTPGCGLRGDPCNAPGQCCSAYCPPDPYSGGQTCGCAAVPGMRCATSDDCCEEASPTLSCVGGACTQACRRNGDVCTSDFSCCSGACGPLGTCVEPCHVQGGACATSAECCADFGCTGGTPGAATCSSSCSHAGNGCAGDDDCCSGLDCRGSTCLAGTCSTQGQACSGDGECCAHLYCSGGSCTCGWLGHSCAGDADCCGYFTCGLDGVCHGENEPDGGSCIGDGDCVLGSCPGGIPADPAVCCQEAATSCAQAGASCCSPSACRGPADGSQTCGDCLPLAAAPCYRTSECCAGNQCDAGRCCKPIAALCAGADECCSARCDLYQSGAGGVPHCCGGAGASCRLDQPSRCCDGYRCSGNGGPWPNGACLAELGAECRSDADCISRIYGSLCIPLAPDTSGPTVCSSWLNNACSADVPCPGGLVCDAVDAVCRVPAGEACTTFSQCERDNECDRGTCCAHPAKACDQPEDCCTGACTGGACACGGPNVHCADAVDCCGGHQCLWRGPANDDWACCALERSPCGTAADCCDNGRALQCDGFCCRPEGSGCTWWEAADALPCCNGTRCTEFINKGMVDYACR